MIFGMKWMRKSLSKRIYSFNIETPKEYPVKIRKHKFNIEFLTECHFSFNFVGVHISRQLDADQAQTGLELSEFDDRKMQLNDCWKNASW